MKRFLKILGGIIVAAALLAGGYTVGSHNGIDSISSALPRVSLNNAAPLSATDMPQNAKPMDKNSDVEKAISEKDAIKDGIEPEMTGRTVVKTNESAAAENWTLIKSYEGSLMNDETSSVVSVYTSAQTEDGEIIWDDGQQWAVEVYDKNGGYYVLMDKYINNGSVYFEVTEIDGETSITVFQSTGAGMEIKQYTYSGNGFKEITLYSSGAANMLCSSIPQYETALN